MIRSCARARSPSAASSRRSASPTRPRPGRRLRARPRRLRPQPHRRGRSPPGVRVPRPDGGVGRDRGAAVPESGGAGRHQPRRSRWRASTSTNTAMPKPSGAWPPPSAPPPRGRGTSWRSAAGRRTPSSASALDEMLPREITLIHGPGCPVCVTPHRDHRQGRGHRRAAGGDLLLVRRHAPRARLAEGPVHGQVGRGRRAGRLLADGRRGAGPRAPGPAGRLLRRRLRDHGPGQRDGGRPGGDGWGWRTSRVLVSHVLVPPAMRAVLDSPANRVQGFLAAGHVCTVTGMDEYRPIAETYRVPIVVTGFEPVDILQGVLMCVRAARRGPARGREPVRPQRCARRATAARTADRRGLPGRAAEVARHRRDPPERARPCGPTTRMRDAERRFGVEAITAEEPAECLAGEMLQGHEKPRDCPAFGIRCTPERPLGAPMVCAEGACAAYYRYRSGVSETG